MLADQFQAAAATPADTDPGSNSRASFPVFAVGPNPRNRQINRNGWTTHAVYHPIQRESLQ
jgi:hypothetical protein